MKMKKVFILFALLCAVVQGAWADDQPWTRFAKRPQIDLDTKNTIYHIKSAEELAYVAKALFEAGDPIGARNVIADIILEADIDLSAHEWVPIGNKWTAFIDNFDGRGHTIKGLRCHRSGEDYVGLFGNVGIVASPRYGSDSQYLRGSISNVILIDSEIEGRDKVGGICGWFHGASINHCVVDAKVKGSTTSVGGIVGETAPGDMLIGGWGPDVLGYPEVHQCLYMGSASDTNGAGIVGIQGIFIYAGGGEEDELGWVIPGTDGIPDKEGYKGKISGNYITNPAMVPRNEYDVRGYEFINVSPESITTSFTDDTKSQVLEYGERKFIPKSGTKMTVTTVDELNRVFHLWLNGREITENNGTYDIDLNDGEQEARITCELTDARLPGNGKPEDPFIIASAQDWRVLAGHCERGLTHFNSSFRLDADITVTQMVGTSEYPFEGTFDGNGHTLTFNAGTESEPIAEDYCAPFRYYQHISIKNLAVKGDIYTKARYAAGLVAQLRAMDSNPQEDCEIADCRSSINIHSTYSGAAYHSGFVAERVSKTYGSELSANFNRCVFDGKLLGESSTDCSGFLAKDDGRTRSGVNITCCLFIPQEVTLAGDNSNFANATLESITNSYYMNWSGTTKQGKQGYTYDYYSAAYGAIGESGKFITTYAKVLSFGNKYYSTRIVSLADNADNTDLLGSLNGQTLDVGLFECTLHKDGSWNTICLPFDVTLSGSVLDGAVARTLSAASISGTTLNLNFGDAVSTLKAGTPYMIKWAAAPVTYTAISGTPGLNGQGYECLVDGRKDTKWGSNSTLSGRKPWECVFKTSSPIIVSGYTLSSGPNCYQNRHPITWTLEAKASEGDEWTVIDSRDVTDPKGYVPKGGDALPWTESTESHIYAIAGAGKPYQYFRFTVFKTANEPLMEVGGLRLISDLRPVFEGVTIDAAAEPVAIAGLESLAFVGSYRPVTLEAGDKTMLYLGSDNKLHYPSEDMTFGSFRALFRLNDNDVRTIVLNLGNGETYNSDIVEVVQMTDTGDNGNLIESLNGKKVDVCLLNRTLHKDGSWNTLCLPFDVTLSGSVLDGAVARPLSAASISGTTLNLNFGDAVSTLKAGTPYIIKWAKETSVDYTAVSGTGSSSSSEDYTKLLDGRDATKWCASNGPWKCVFTTSSAVAVTGYTLTTASDATRYETRNPQKWTLEAKASAADEWTVIDSRDATVNSGDALPRANATESKVYAVARGNQSYRYFRFTVSQTGGSQMQLAELKLQCNLASLSPTFEDVTIDAAAKHDFDNGASGDQRVRFVGTYKSTAFDADNWSTLLMGSDNTLFYPAKGAGIGAQRAYIKIGDDGTAQQASARRVTSFNISYGDGNSTTGIISIAEEPASQGAATGWYTLDGRRLSGKPTQKGIYINDGKKVVIK